MDVVTAAAVLIMLDEPDTFATIAELAGTMDPRKLDTITDVLAWLQR